MNLSRTTHLLVAGAAVVVVVAGLRAAAGIVGPVMLALALTIVFHPVRVLIERRVPPWVASIIVLLCAYALILGLTLALVLSVGRLAVLVPSYAPQMDDLASEVGDRLAAGGVGGEQVDAVVGALHVGQLFYVATPLLGSVLSVLSNLLFILTVMFFLAFDSARVGRLAAGARRHRPQLVDALSSFAVGTRSYLGVSAVFGLIVAVVDTAALWALGIPGAFVWGVLAFVTNFIPNIGFVIGLVPPALIAALEGGWGLMLAVIVVYAGVNVVIQSFIQPRYVGKTVGLSTTLTFLSLVFWAWVLGPLGALLALPMSLFFKAILVDADPQARWLDPLIRGQPAEETAAEAP